MNEHVTHTIRAAIARRRVAHAYLFSGSDTVAQLAFAYEMADALNCENLHAGQPCEVCPLCPLCRSCRQTGRRCSAVVESDQTVAAIRQFVPRDGWTVYVLTTADTLSTVAASALMRVLVEPPERVVIVLTTSAPQMVPPAIRARVQHFEFVGGRSDGN